MKKISNIALFTAAMLIVYFITGCAGGPTATTLQQAQVLNLGTTVSANLGRGTEHWYSIQSPTATTVIVYTTGNTDTILRAYDSDHFLIARDLDSGEGTNARLEIPLEAGRTYLISVRNWFFSVGPYDIIATTREIEQRAETAARQQAQQARQQEQQARQQAEAAARQQAEVEAGLRQARALSLGTAFSANLGWDTVHWYSVQSPTAATVIVYTTGNTNTFLRAYDSNNSLITEDDDSGEGRNARLEIPLEAGRTYLFRVSGHSNSTGSYQVMATTQAIQQEQQAEAAARQRAEAAAGFFTLWSEYSGTVMINGAASEFQATANEPVNIRVEAAAGREYTITVRDPEIGQARGTISFQQTGPNNRQHLEIFDPNPPPNRAEDFEIIQNVDGGLTITRYTSTRRQLIIPDTLHGVRVTMIGERAFEGRNLVSVVIPNLVTEIGDGAFRWNNISVLALPASLRYIGIEAFTGNSIESLTIPNGVTVIRGRAFSQNPLNTVVIQASLSIRTVENRRDNFGGFSNVVTAGIGANAFGELGGGGITRVTLTANIDEASMRAGFEESLVNFYISQNRAAGRYVKNGPIWIRE